MNFYYSTTTNLKYNDFNYDLIKDEITKISNDKFTIINQYDNLDDIYGPIIILSKICMCDENHINGKVHISFNVKGLKTYNIKELGLILEYLLSIQEKDTEVDIEAKIDMLSNFRNKFNFIGKTDFKPIITEIEFREKFKTDIENNLKKFFEYLKTEDLIK